MTAAPAAPTEVELPVLLGLAEIARLFPQVAQQTVYRWRVVRGKSGPALPEPVLTVSKTPMWTEDTILEFAEARGLRVDRAELKKIRRAQGR